MKEKHYKIIVSLIGMAVLLLIAIATKPPKIETKIVEIEKEKIVTIEKESACCKRIFRNAKEKGYRLFSVSP